VLRRVTPSRSIPNGRPAEGHGRDPKKKVTGRKRHVIVDTLGLLLAVVVHPANEHDSQTAPSVLKQLLGQGKAPEGDFCR
jgi:putative transposase